MLAQLAAEFPDWWPELNMPYWVMSLLRVVGGLVVVVGFAVMIGLQVAPGAADPATASKVGLGLGSGLVLFGGAIVALQLMRVPQIVSLYDDRLEDIPYDEATDLVAISVETYTARRAYQIASEFRKRGVPVVMGGFHATLCPDEVRQHCESIVIGEAEDTFPELIEIGLGRSIDRQD